MPVVESSFSPPLLIRNGHVQTILSVLLPRAFPESCVEERMELEDGDFLELGWARVGARRAVVLTHGLEGDRMAGCVRGMAQTLNRAGWDALAWSFRGCGVEPNRLLRFYHSGETGDLGAVIRHAAGPYEEIALVGFSLGGNVTLKYMGEADPHPKIVAAAAVSAPVDLASCARALDQRWSNRLYLGRFMKSLVAKIEAKAVRFPGEIEVTGARSIRSFAEFDDRFTAPIHGFRNAADYWEQSSARQYLARITVPTLLLNARNDPMLAQRCFPFEEAEVNPCFFFEAPASGGHVGFFDFRNGIQPWSERRVAEFLERRGR